MGQHRQTWVFSLCSAMLFQFACNENKSSKRKDEPKAATTSSEDSSRKSDIEMQSAGGKELSFKLSLPDDYIEEKSNSADALEDDAEKDAASSSIDHIDIKCKTAEKAFFGSLAIRIDKREDGSAIPTPEPTPAEGGVEEVLSLADMPEFVWTVLAQHSAPVGCRKGLSITLKNIPDGVYRIAADLYAADKIHSFSGQSEPFTVKDGKIVDKVVLVMKRLKPEDAGGKVKIRWEDDKRHCAQLMDGPMTHWKEHEGLPPKMAKEVMGKRCIGMLSVQGSDASSGSPVSAHYQILRTRDGKPAGKWLPQVDIMNTKQTFYLVPGVYSVLGFSAKYQPSIQHNLVIRPGEVVDIKLAFTPRDGSIGGGSTGGSPGQASLESCHAEKKALDLKKQLCREDTVELIPCDSVASLAKVIETRVKPALSSSAAALFDKHWNDKVSLLLGAEGLVKILQCYTLKEPYRFAVSFEGPEGIGRHTVTVNTEKQP